MTKIEWLQVPGNRHNQVISIADEIHDIVTNNSCHQTGTGLKATSPDDSFLIKYHQPTGDLLVLEMPDTTQLSETTTAASVYYYFEVKPNGETTIFTNKNYFEFNKFDKRYACTAPDKNGGYILAKDIPVNKLPSDLFRFMLSQLNELKHSFLSKNN